MKKNLLVIVFIGICSSISAQHNVYMNFFDFLQKINTAGYRYNLSDYSSIGGEVSFSNVSNPRLVYNAKKTSYFQVASEYLVFFFPKQGCDKFYVGPNLAYRNIELDKEYNFIDEFGSYQTALYKNTSKDLMLSLSIGGLWRHPTGFFFNASGTLGRSIFNSESTTRPDYIIEETTDRVVFRLGLNVGWMFGGKTEKK